MYFPPIPDEQHASDTLPPLHECGEPLMPLSKLSPKISVHPYYYLEGYAGAMPEAYLRKGVAMRLVQAAERLPQGYSLVVLDAWRPYEVQHSLYERFKQSLLAAGWPEGSELDQELRKFVAPPTRNILQPPPHLSGGALDLTIAGPDGWLNMGTPFDDFSERARTSYFEHVSDDLVETIAIRDNRRLLYHLMTHAGFVNYPEEWWHYEYGTLTWARLMNTTAIYGGVLTLPSHQP